MRVFALPVLLALLCVVGCMDINIKVDTSKITYKTSPNFASFNIDTSANRGFFQRNPADPNLRYLAKQIAPAYLRVGGTGNDDLTYDVNSNASGRRGEVLNSTWWDNLNGFSEYAGLNMVFGLNLAKRTSDNKWDPTNARSLIEYSIKKGYKFFGFELGNEQNNRFTGAEEVADFLILAKLLEELYPDASFRPKIIGPDPHSFRTKNPNTDWLASFMDEAMKNKLDMFAITHHEYIEVDVNTTTDPSLLDTTLNIGQHVYEAVQQHYPQAETWAGEIGPHNGGSPPCSHESMRWANYADTFWYLDAMGSKAAAGYSAFCRQDFIGADYGLLDCMTHTPLPDYYGNYIWTRVMGTGVLNTTVSGSTHIRAYAHCSARSRGGVSIVLMNLDQKETANVALSLSAKLRVEYRLSPTQGLSGTGASLNGKPLVYSPMKLPSIEGLQVDNKTPLVLKPLDIMFVEFPDENSTTCM